MPNDIYSVGGYASCLSGSFSGKFPPNSNLKGLEFGQNYFDTSTSPPTQYVWNGQTWVLSGSGAVTAAFASPPALGSTTPNSGAFTTVTTTGSITAGGNVILNGSATQLQIQGGAVTDFIGTATLQPGTGSVTIANTNIAAGDRIMISRSALNASPALGSLIYTITPATSFTVASFTDAGAAATTDVSSFTYVIIREI